MRVSLLLCVAAWGSIYAAKEVLVKTYHESDEECATWLDDYMFNETLYRMHYTRFYSIETEAEENTRSASLDTHSRVKRDMYKTVKLWPNATIPYLISCDYSESERIFFANSMRVLEERTCIRFVRNEEVVSDTFLYMDKTPTKDTDCSANRGSGARWEIVYDGKPSFYTKYSLRGKCFRTTYRVGTVTHELMHTLGFYHQHNRFDSPITMETDPKVPQNDSLFYGPYDPNSSAGYARPRYLTDIDVLKINRAYQCSSTTRGNRPIDLTKVEPLPTKSKGEIYSVPEKSKCYFNGEPKRNVASFTVDFQRKTINFTNILEPSFEGCWSSNDCLLPYLKITDQGDDFSITILKDSNRSVCTVIYIWSEYVNPNYQQAPGWDVNSCTAVVETDEGETFCIVAKFK